MRPICSSDALKNGGAGFRFFVQRGGRAESAFAVRYKNIAYAYLNRCSHVPTELDWTPGEFFESGGRYLVCATHGALYSPESGRCVSGRCQGKGLQVLKVVELDDVVYLTEE